MKKLFLILLLVFAPSLSLAEEVVLGSSMGPGPRSALKADIFHFRAHTCFAGAVNCGPDNIVGTVFATYIDLFVPVTQNYTRIYLVTDIEGELQFGSVFASVLTGGTRNTLFVTPTLPPGLYQFISLVIGDDGRVALSGYYRFRVV